MDFFTYEGSNVVSFMSIEYYIITLVTFLSIILIYIFRNKLKKLLDENKTRMFMGIILLSNMIIYLLSKGLSGQFRYVELFPIHLCYITNLAIGYMLITNKKEMFKYLFYFVMIGPLPSVLIPEIAFNYDRVGFWGFIISHNIILIFTSMLLFVYNYDVTKKARKKTLELITLIYAILFLFNTFFHTNYLFQYSLPDHIYKIFPFFKYFNHPLFLTFSTLILFMFIAEFVIDFKNKHILKTS